MDVIGVRGQWEKKIGDTWTSEGQGADGRKNEVACGRHRGKGHMAEKIRWHMDVIEGKGKLEIKPTASKCSQ